jgi:hypothetical protein
MVYYQVMLHQQKYLFWTVGLTAIEADTELWRRLIKLTLIWKSKGTRKSIEFILKFIGAPIGLLTFNEYIKVMDQ